MLQPHQITGTIRVATLCCKALSRDKTSSAFFTFIVIAGRQKIASDKQFTGDTGGNQLQMLIHHQQTESG
jgi:hypothetical protein